MEVKEQALQPEEEHHEALGSNNSNNSSRSRFARAKQLFSRLISSRLHRVFLGIFRFLGFFVFQSYKLSQVPRRRPCTHLY